MDEKPVEVTPTDDRKTELLDAAEAWDAIARAEEAWAAIASVEDAMDEYDRSIGIFVGDGSSPANHHARRCRATAKALRLEAETGIPHCVCCLKPRCDNDVR